MDNMKKLPLAMAVVAALCPISVLAQEFTPEQIDAIVEQAVDKALAERYDHIVAEPQTADVLDPQAEQVISPEKDLPYGFKFSGYGRYGAHFKGGDQKYVGVDGSYNGSSAIGRLGNEANGGEFQLTKMFKGSNGAIWDLNVMFSHWGDEVNLAKASVGVTNILESNPDAYLWAGREYHQRPQQGLNDYFWMNHDGQGAGVKNFDIGGVQFDVAAVSAVESCDLETLRNAANPSQVICAGGSNVGDNGHYAITSRVHGMKLGALDLELYANYGFDSKDVDGDDRMNAWQGAVVLGHSDDKGSNKLIVRYSDNSDNSVYTKTDDLTTLYASFEGLHKFSAQDQVEYLVAYHDFDNSDDRSENRQNYNAIVRPMHWWNDVHSTWLEAGYQYVDYDSGEANQGWKLTLSQNISIDMGPEFRPMLRFYVTGGEVENKHTASVNHTSSETLDSFNVGAMWEAGF